MKNLLVCVLLVLCKVWTGFAQNTASISGSPTEKEVRQLEMRRFELMVARDMKGLEALLADDLTYTHSNGVLENKEQFLAKLNSGKTLYQSIQSEDVRVRVIGDVAIINGIALMRVWTGGQTQDLRLRYTDIYARREGRWQLILWQSTRVQ